MESQLFYKRVFYAGSAWNWFASIPTFFLVPMLPGLIHIEGPRYPIFIYFNLMTVMLFGCIQFTVARNLASTRPFVKILVWSKILTVIIFAGALVLIPMPSELVGFIGPGMFIDLVFGLLFWRYLKFSESAPAVR
jgi:hypothetical protein